MTKSNPRSSADRQLSRTHRRWKVFDQDLIIGTILADKRPLSQHGSDECAVAVVSAALPDVSLITSKPAIPGRIKTSHPEVAYTYRVFQSMQGTFRLFRF